MVFRVYSTKLNEDELRVLRELWDEMGDKFFRERCRVADTGCDECKYKGLCAGLEKTGEYLKKSVHERFEQFVDDPQSR